MITWLAAGSSDIMIDSAFTIEGWIFVQDTSGTNKTILSKVNSSSSEGYACWFRAQAQTRAMQENCS